MFDLLLFLAIFLAACAVAEWIFNSVCDALGAFRDVFKSTPTRVEQRAGQSAERLSHGENRPRPSTRHVGQETNMRPVGPGIRSSRPASRLPTKARSFGDDIDWCRRPDGSLLAMVPTALTKDKVAQFLDFLESKAHPDRRDMEIQRGRCAVISHVGLEAQRRGYTTRYKHGLHLEYDGWLLSRNDGPGPRQDPLPPVPPHRGGRHRGEP